MRPLRYLSLCSGIEAASVAWRPLGWEPVAFAEIEPFPCAVLAHHYPAVPNLGDITKVADWRPYRGTVDLVVAGTPCQDFSIAGRRAGLAGERSALALVFAQMLSVVRPVWFVWENVPGVFSTAGGGDFGTFIGTLDDIGYSVAWRVLDAQYFGVPQRRRRVFVVGHLGDWRPAAAVLFEPSSLRGDTPARGETRKNIAATLKGGSGNRGWENGCECTFIPQATQALTGRLGGGGPDDNKAQGGFYIPDIVEQAMSCKWSKGTSGPAGDEHHNLVCAPLTARPYADNEAQDSRLVVSQYGDKANALTAEGADASPCADRGPTILAFHGAQDPDISGDVTHPLGCNQGQEVCVMQGRWRGDDGRGYDRPPHVADLPQVSRQKPDMIAGAHAVRRLTPLECERLQGFPDHYTDIEFRGRPAADGPRYRALGNSMCVNVMKWIGERLDAVNKRI